MRRSPPPLVPARNQDAKTAARRRGAIIILALIALLLVTMIGGSLMKLALTQRRQVQYELLRLQADWLMESGLERAAARLSAEANYTGETWSLGGDELGSGRKASVVIRVLNIENDAARRRVAIAVEYPTDMTLQARPRREFLVRLPSKSSSPEQSTEGLSS